MRVLVADSFEEAGRRELARLGHEVLYRPALDAAGLPAALAADQPDVLVVRSTAVSGDALRADPALKLVVRAGAGVDTIDVAAAAAQGVPVANCPGTNAIAVAELTWALILACDRRVPDQTADLRAGRWDKRTYAEARGLFGRTLGVLGLGPIGLAVIDRARAFGMDVVAWSRSLDEARAAELGVARAAGPVEVARAADVLTIHLASTPETRKLVGRDVLDALRPGAIVVNTSRGAVLDEDALREAIARTGLRAGLDVYEGEPRAPTAAWDSAVIHAPGVYGTHHVGASTEQAQAAVATEAVRVIATFASTGEVLHRVGREILSDDHPSIASRPGGRPDKGARP